MTWSLITARSSMTVLASVGKDRAGVSGLELLEAAATRERPSTTAAARGRDSGRRGRDRGRRAHADRHSAHPPAPVTDANAVGGAAKRRRGSAALDTVDPPRVPIACGHGRAERRRLVPIASARARAAGLEAAPEVSFGNAISHCGSFVNIRGAHAMSRMVWQTPRKSIRRLASERLEGCRRDLSQPPDC
jgi:hypothetical protein